MATTVGLRNVHSPPPRVRLVAWTRDPYGLVVGSARTCYASEFVLAGSLGPKGERNRTTLAEALPAAAEPLAKIGDLATPHEERLRLVAAVQRGIDDDAIRNAVALFADLARQRAEADARITASIYEAGHHTPFQHPTFVFALQDVSRNVVESFFHNHTFYNSEQQSQRYVEMKDAQVTVPPGIAADPHARDLFEGAVRTAWDAYHGLRALLTAPNEKVMGAIARIKGQSQKQAHKEAEKKAQEMARYVIPVAAHTQLYHTVSGVVLLRYLRMCQANSTPAEARSVVEAMVDEVRKVDPAFVAATQEDPHDRDELLEWGLAPDTTSRPEQITKAESRLVRATPDADAVVADAVREVSGAAGGDEVLLSRLLDPGVNHVWNDTLNTWDHSPMLRTLHHVHLTFRKRLSLTAYAQDQRHRMTPGTRPLLQRCLGERAVYVPDVIAADEEARARYDAALGALFDAIDALRGKVPDEELTYLLPNATLITYTQSGDLLAWIHKWRLRLCFNAQKEIFEASLAELRAAQEVMPALTRFIGPPCSFIAAALPPERQDDIAACCPEGDRWCGVKVWKNFDAKAGKPKRPY